HCHIVLNRVDPRCGRVVMLGGKMRLLAFQEAVARAEFHFGLSPEPGALARGKDGLFRTDPPLEADPLARLRTGALEMSNVEAASVLVELVEQSRGFEIQTKLLAAAKEMDESAARLMRVEG
ncbi:MAG: flagellar basal body rod C-terminal domain-containing protein, partial [Thermaurantiacus tibetensis]